MLWVYFAVGLMALFGFKGFPTWGKLLYFVLFPWGPPLLLIIRFLKAAFGPFFEWCQSE